uniref:Protein misato homolog 1 n=1 Tax=Poecilia reticulata TaxID=8081 RepID=A0A3P9NX53_POERE
MTGVCREVITLQLGHYSNFVGTHWWNLQDASLCYDPVSAPPEVQSDSVFREGQTPGGSVTYTPRLIAMDLKGSLRTLRQEGSLYDPGGASAAGSVTVHKHSPPEKNCFLEDLEKLDVSAGEPEPGSEPDPGLILVLIWFQKNYRLEGSVTVWSDFLRLHLHPRSVVIMHQFNHDGEAHRLETFGQGESALQGALLDELEDRLHFFVEECDYLQGFQVLCDLEDGFAGLGSKVTELLQDSYSGRGILTWGLAPTPARDRYHLLNAALGTVNMAAHSSLFCPLTLRGGLSGRPPPPPLFPLLSYNPALWYHSSAILALALDALTVPYRLRNNSAPMWQVADSLAVAGRKVVAAYGAVPFPMMPGGSLPDALSACAATLPWKPLSACPEAAGGRCYGQWSTLRGYEGQKLIRSSARRWMPRASCAAGRPLQAVSVPVLCRCGRRLCLNRLSSAAPPVSSVPILTSLQSGTALRPFLSELQRAAATFDVRRRAPSFLSQGPEMADYQEALEELRLLGRCYHDDSGGGTTSSEDDDD